MPRRCSRKPKKTLREIMEKENNNTEYWQQILNSAINLIINS